MKQLLFSLPVLIALCPALAIAESTARQIHVTGEGVVEAVPDMALINVGVSHRAKTAAAALGAVSDSAAALLDRLRGEGVADRDVQTRSISLNPVRKNKASSLGGAEDIAAFDASTMLTVRVRDLETLGERLDLLVGDGANQLHGLNFSVQDPAPLMTEARRRAVADAEATAALLAESAGVTLGLVVTIRDQGGSGPVMLESAGLRRSGPPVAAGEISIRASVSVVYGIAEP